MLIPSVISVQSIGARSRQVCVYQRMQHIECPRMRPAFQPRNSIECDRKARPNDSILCEVALAHDIACTRPRARHCHRTAMCHMRCAITVRDCELEPLVQHRLWQVDETELALAHTLRWRLTCLRLEQRLHRVCLNSCAS